MKLFKLTAVTRDWAKHALGDRRTVGKVQHPKNLFSDLRGDLRKRRRPLQAAAALFELGLVVAASAPVASAVSVWVCPQHIMLNYEWKPDGKLWAQLAGEGLKAYSAVEVSVQTKALPPVDLARVRKAADAGGKAEASLEVVLPYSPGTVLHLTGK